MFTEERRQTEIESYMLELEGKFPRTYKRSFFGIKLSEEDLNARCGGLSYWMNGILTRYHMLDMHQKGIINEFLKIISSKTAEEEARNQAIFRALNGKPTTTLSGRTSEKNSEGYISYSYDESVMSPSIEVEPVEKDYHITEIPICHIDKSDASLVTGKEQNNSSGDDSNAVSNQVAAVSAPETVFTKMPKEENRTISTVSSDFETVTINSHESSKGRIADVSI